MVKPIRKEERRLEAPQAQKKRMTPAGWCLVIGVWVGMVALIWCRVIMRWPVISIWEIEDPDQVFSWLRRVVVNLAYCALAFCVFGVVIGVAFLQRTRTSSEPPSVRFREWCLATAITAVMAYLAMLVARMQSPLRIELVTAVLGVGVGTWMSWWWVGSWKSRGWLLIQVTGFSAVMFVSGWVLLSKSVSSEPLGFSSVSVSTTEKQKLIELVRNTKQPGSHVRRLMLTELQVNQLISMAAALCDGQPKIQAKFQDQSQINAVFSMALPRRFGDNRILNVICVFELSVKNGNAHFSLRRLELGEVWFPQFTLRSLSYVAKEIVMDNPDLAILTQATHYLVIKKDRFEIAGNWSGLRRGISGEILAKMGAKPEVADMVVIHLRHLIERAPDLPAGEDRFIALMRESFRLAHERSAQGTDPRVENAAVVFALGIIAGHSKVEMLVGNATIGELRGKWSQWPPATVYGREDLPRHFWVSAALAVASSKKLSDAVGLLKEELDASAGGTGFSFADLAADMAGSRFALYVTRDDRTARQVQRQMQDDVDMADLFPVVSDLPENITSARLESVYGGIDGAGYRDMLVKIERRLNRCRFLLPNRPMEK